MENENENDLAVKFKNTCGKWWVLPSL